MSIMRLVSRLSLVFVPVLAASILFAAEIPTFTTKTRSIATFKNGLGFFLRDGEAALADGWAMTESVPAAALGTFWVGSSASGVSVERLIAAQEDVKRTAPATSVQDMLAGNVGKRLRLAIGDKVVEGKLLSVPGPELALIETSAGTSAVNRRSVSWVEFEGAASPDFTISEKAKRLRFKLAGAGSKAPITIGYLQKGITWSPAYLIDLLDDKTARITMQGLLANDVEDIEGADVYFVVGYPNFMYADIVSPLALTQSVTSFIGAMSGSTSPVYHGALAQSVSNVADYEWAGRTAGPSESPGFGYSGVTAMPGAPEEDLFLYQAKGVSLKKGERAYYTVFSAEAPFEHVYEWSIPDTSGIQPNGYVGNPPQSREVPTEEQIWHKLKLTNKSKFPWTTGPAMAMSKGSPLSQDILMYTPKGADGSVKITVATDIRGKRSETEKSREPDALKGYGYTFYKITSEGQLTLKNFKSRQVTVDVKKTLVGEVLSASDDGAATKTAEAVRSVNPTSIISWKAPLKPGEEKKLTYTYFTYVRY